MSGSAYEMFVANTLRENVSDVTNNLGLSNQEIINRFAAGETTWDRVKRERKEARGNEKPKKDKKKKKKGKDSIKPVTTSTGNVDLKGQGVLLADTDPAASFFITNSLDGATIRNPQIINLPETGLGMFVDWVLGIRDITSVSTVLTTMPIRTNPILQNISSATLDNGDGHATITISNITAHWDKGREARDEFNNVLNGRGLSDPSKIYFRWPIYESIKNPYLYNDGRNGWNYGIIDIPN